MSANELTLPPTASRVHRRHVARFGRLGVETGGFVLAPRGSDAISTVALAGRAGIARRRGAAPDQRTRPRPPVRPRRRASAVDPGPVSLARVRGPAVAVRHSSTASPWRASHDDRPVLRTRRRETPPGGDGGATNALDSRCARRIALRRAGRGHRLRRGRRQCSLSTRDALGAAATPRAWRRAPSQQAMEASRDRRSASTRRCPAWADRRARAADTLRRMPGPPGARADGLPGDAVDELAAAVAAIDPDATADGRRARRCRPCACTSAPVGATRPYASFPDAHGAHVAGQRTAVIRHGRAGKPARADLHRRARSRRGVQVHRPGASRSGACFTATCASAP